MRPVLFSYRGIAIHAYPAMLYAGLVLGAMVGYVAAERSGMDATRVYAATLILTLPALTGTRLLFVALHWDIYRGAPARILRRSEGGAALYGGLLLALVVSLPLLRAMRLGFWAFWDIATVTILVGMVFTKIGCLLNGCCAGRPTSGVLALYLPGHRGIWARRIPSQPLESVLAALLLVGILVVWRWAPFDGFIFLCAASAYGVGRVLLEDTRETTDRVGSISAHTAVSWCLLGMSGAALLARWFILTAP
jgi:prolipoprotein diacylglyceryl transferase